MNKEFLNNVFLKGKIINPQILSVKPNACICAATLEIKRNSGIIDYIPIRIYKKLLDNLPSNNNFVEIIGSFRSYRKNSKLILYVWADSINPLYTESYENKIKIAGDLCKLLPLRTTPLTQRIILDYFITIKQDSYTYFFPFIAWYMNALSISNLELGTFISITGRLQSRNYTKKYNNGVEENKLAYEISTISFSIIN